VDPDSEDEDGNGSVIIGLMQKDRRKLRREGKNELTIGYAVYQVRAAFKLHSVIDPLTLFVVVRVCWQ